MTYRTALLVYVTIIFLTFGILVSCFASFATLPKNPVDLVGEEVERAKCWSGTQGSIGGMVFVASCLLACSILALVLLPSDIRERLLFPILGATLALSSAGVYLSNSVKNSARDAKEMTGIIECDVITKASKASIALNSTLLALSFLLLIVVCIAWARAR